VDHNFKQPLLNTEGERIGWKSFFICVSVFEVRTKRHRAAQEEEEKEEEKNLMRTRKRTV
jgi:hypothetical protein